MYKKVLSCVLAISLAICVSAKEKSIKQQIHEDFLYFKECITQAYVNYDEAKKDYGFDIDDCIKEAEKMYLKKSGRSKEIDRVLISKGFYPDYWTSKDELLQTLQFLTDDDSLAEAYI